MVLRVNMGAAADTYTAVAANSTNVETHIRDADLSLPVSSTTGANSAVTPVIAGNATVVKQIASLTPGTHTLAVAVHNAAVGSSDLSMAVQLIAEAGGCSISASVGEVTRSDNATPLDHLDDKISFPVTVTAAGTFSPTGWTIQGPEGSAAVGLTGAYDTSVSIANIPISEFNAGPLALKFADAVTSTCTSTVAVSPQRIMASDNHNLLNIPVFTTGPIPASGWVFDDALRSMTMTNGGGGARKVLTSGVIDLTGVPAVTFSGVFYIDDTSTGNEAQDSFVAYLVLDGNTANRINLITPYDTIVADGVLSDNELAPAGGVFTRSLDYLIPGSANSVQIVVEGINDSPTEQFVVYDLRISTAPPTLLTIPGPVTVDNRGTVPAADDTFSAPVNIEGVNLGASTGWTSNVASPASGSYANPQPVVFGPFNRSSSPLTVRLTDLISATASASFSLTAPVPALAASAASNIVRRENGPGTADDTVTFDVTVTGTAGGPRWTSSTAGVSPASGNFGVASLTISAPLPASPVSLVLRDASYPAATQTVSVAIPGRYPLGQRNFGGGLTDVGTALTPAPSTVWVNDPVARITYINSGVNAQTETIHSEILDLSAVGEVRFTATLSALDTAVSSNYETADKFKAELIIDGGLASQSIINLVTPYDTGNGASAVPGNLPNGPPDGWINGYQGTASVADGYATIVAEYNANKTRDEFNRNAQNGEASMSADVPLTHLIAAAASTVQLRISSQGIQSGETALLKDVLFAVTGPTLDADGDGMTDAYEDANGLNRNSNADKLTDLDGDGQNNYSEFLAGTAANNSASTLKITAIVPSGSPNVYNVSVASVAGKRYQLQRSSDLGNVNAWADIPGVVTAAGVLTTLPVNTTGFGSKHYLRAKVVP